MTYNEIDEAFRREISEALNKINEVAKKFGGIVKKTRLFPVCRVFSVLTKNKTNLHLIFVATKPSQWRQPALCVYSIFYYRNCYYAISIDKPDGVAFIYTSHFFERYRQRIVKDQDMAIEDLIKRFMMRNKDMIWVPNSSAFSKAYEKYEHEDVPQKAARVEEGNCFLEVLGQKLFLVKTILSDDNLCGAQEDAFGFIEEMRQIKAEKTKQV